MIYLASPYAHEDVQVMEERFEQAARAAFLIMRKEICCYSPIAHNHPIAVRFDLPRTWDFWQLMDLPMLAKANQLWVLKLLGWELSKGVAAETAFARSAGIPVSWVTLPDLEKGFG